MSDANSATEEVLGFQCEGEQLWGILHRPAKPRSRAVLVVVGGPQTRVGSHRQFVLLARGLAAAGYPCLRFDYRGMGDSTGSIRNFEAIDEDITAALDALGCAVPEVTNVALWGLCDAASAALFIAPREPRLSGLVLLNPWVRSEQGLARSYLKRYYLQRLTSRELWSKVFSGEFDYRGSWASLVKMVKSAIGGERPAAAVQGGGRETGESAASADTGVLSPAVPAGEALAKRMADGLAAFDGPCLFILSGRDLTAGEFKDAVKASRHWRNLLRNSQVTVQHFPVADHTFSTRAWRDQVTRWTAEWLKSY